ncbi:MAG: hypothetical protein V1732_02720 [Patescibacteria group bacterium]
MDGITFPITLNYSSNSFGERVDKIVEQEQEKMLKNDIGEDLFNQLSYADRIFMIKTAGSIDFGHPIDLDKIAQDIESYENY